MSALQERLRSQSGVFRSAEPFPNVVIDNAVSHRCLTAVLKSFPDTTEMSTQFAGRHEVKSAENEWSRISEATRSLLAQLNSAAFIDALEELSGIQGLIADTRLIGGGLHQIGRGGKLNVHADFNYFEATRLHRRLNVL